MFAKSKNQSGISSATIILFGLLVLTVVLVDALSIIYHHDNEQNAVTASILKYCGKTYPAYPPQCPITKIYDCDENYVLQNDCLGTGTVVLTAAGRQTSWCDYTSFDTEPTKCLTVKPNINNCFSLQNLCK